MVVYVFYICFLFITICISFSNEYAHVYNINPQHYLDASTYNS